MDDVTSFKRKTSKSGIDASVTDDAAPVAPVEASIYSARPDSGSQPNAGNEEKLAWPPVAEDLKRLYLEQKLSASKIAKVYGLAYASEKTAESTILYHLKKNGITRRDPAAHIKKVTDSLVDEWVERYQKGESLKQIAGDTLSPVTVFNHLHKRGIQLRDKVEAQIKAVTIHDKKPFQGSPADKAYIAGITRGDFWAGRHGRAVRVRLGTTHPDMADLFRQLFSKHGPIYEYPKPAALTEYEWILDCDLDSSFEFLVQSKTDVSEFIRSSDLFMSFLAGFYDAEGTVYFHKKGNGGAFELAIVNTDAGLLREIGEALSRRGFALKLERVRVDQERAVRSGVKNPGEFRWRIMMWRFEDVYRLMAAMPVRHAEKVAKIEIALRIARLTDSQQRAAAMIEWKLLLSRIRNGRNQYIARARAVYERRIGSENYLESNIDSIQPDKLI
jgi:LAGLIDADG-like domain